MLYSFDQLGELGRLSASMKKLEKELKNSNKYEVCSPGLFISSSKFLLLVYPTWDRDCLTFICILIDFVQNEHYRAKLKASNERTLALIKAGMDIVVAVGLLQLAPKKVTPRVTGAFGFISSLISCYQVPASVVIVCFLLDSFYLGYPKVPENLCDFCTTNEQRKQNLIKKQKTKQNKSY